MHIPDGYLGPKTWVTLWVAMIPLWFLAGRKLERTLRVKEIPLLALGAVFTFVVMMLNFPIPGGAAGHVVGTVVVAIILGPWAALVAVSLVLALQAFILGDGGITALGANAFNMAFLAGFTGYALYSFFLKIGTSKWFASALAAFIAINISALASAVELGLQPALAYALDGRALYAPYPLSVTLPAVMAPHLLFFGPVEAVGTALVVNYIFKTNPSFSSGPVVKSRPLLIAAVAMVALVPLGLFVGANFSVWGEWPTEELNALIGYLPEGMAAYSSSWSLNLPAYFGGLGNYVLASLLGSVLIVGLIYTFGRFKNKEAGIE